MNALRGHPFFLLLALAIKLVHAKFQAASGDKVPSAISLALETATPPYCPTSEPPVYTRLLSYKSLSLNNV